MAQAMSVHAWHRNSLTELPQEPAAYVPAKGVQTSRNQFPDESSLRLRIGTGRLSDDPDGYLTDLLEHMVGQIMSPQQKKSMF